MYTVKFNAKRKTKCFVRKHYFFLHFISLVPTHFPSVYFRELECVQRIVGDPRPFGSLQGSFKLRWPSATWRGTVAAEICSLPFQKHGFRGQSLV